MSAEAESVPSSPQAKPPKRRLRNFLLDARFQLKYTGMVVLVTVVVTGLVGWWLGSKAYEQSRETSEMLIMQGGGGAELGELDDEFHQLLVEETRAQDLRVRNRIITGIVLLVVVLALALGFTGIIVTHRVVGPAYKLKLLLGDVARGQLNVRGGLRKGDELQDVGDAFKTMVVALRERREEELSDLDAAIAMAKDKEIDEDVLSALNDLRGRLQATLDA